MPIAARPYATHWQDWGNLVLGFVLMVSPWMLDYAARPGAAWNAWVFGIVVAALAVAALIRFARWVEWVMVAVGVWLAVSPWLLGFAPAGVVAATWAHVAVGGLVAGLALWNGLAHGQRRRVVWE